MKGKSRHETSTPNKLKVFEYLMWNAYERERIGKDFATPGPSALCLGNVSDVITLAIGDKYQTPPDRSLLSSLTQIHFHLPLCKRANSYPEI